MKSTQPTSEQWSQCPDGQFLELAESLRNQTGRRRFLVVSATAAAGSLAGLGIWALSSTDGLKVIQGVLSGSAANYGGISCEEVKENIDSFVSQQCDPLIADRIDAHIELCLNCKNLLAITKAKKNSV